MRLHGLWSNDPVAADKERGYFGAVKPHSLCVALLLLSCTAPEPGSQGERAFRILRGISDAVLRIDGLAAVRKYAPELEPILNPDTNEVITLAEIDAAAEQILADPEMSALLLATAIYLQRR
jgi:hypothetical protein